MEKLTSNGEEIAFIRLSRPVKIISILFSLIVTCKGVLASAFALLFKKMELEILIPVEEATLDIAEPKVALLPMKTESDTIAPL